MKRTQVNFAIDAAAFAGFVLLLSTGLLLRYQLPPGSGDLHGVGSGHGASNRLISSLWSFTRHQWGDIHYWIAVVLMAALAVHVALHWKWIVCVVRGTASDASGMRFGLGAASLIALLALGVAPLVVPTEQATRGELQEGAQEAGASQSAGHGSELRGSMTVRELSEATGVSAAELKTRLDLPEIPAADERVGRLLRRNQLAMSDLREVVEDRPDARKETEP